MNLKTTLRDALAASIMILPFVSGCSNDGGGMAADRATLPNREVSGSGTGAAGTGSSAESGGTTTSGFDGSGTGSS